MNAETKKRIEESIELGKGQDHYVRKAQTERGLTTEQITYFLDRCEDFTLLPYFCTHVKRDPEQDLQTAVEWVLEMHPDTRKE